MYVFTRAICMFWKLTWLIHPYNNQCIVNVIRVTPATTGTRIQLACHGHNLWPSQQKPSVQMHCYLHPLICLGSVAPQLGYILGVLRVLTCSLPRCAYRVGKHVTAAAHFLRGRPHPERGVLVCTPREEFASSSCVM
jgi:hypothetical protein